MSTHLSKRHFHILRIVREQGSCAISELSRRLDVSLETIRRDVRPLTESGQLVKMHGAVSLPIHMSEPPFDVRMAANAEAKRRIAAHMAGHIKDGDSIMLDTGTTTSILARELLSRKNLTVVTNSSDIARTLATTNGNTVFMAGGELDGDSGAAFGASAIEFVERFKVGYAVISIGAISKDIGPMDYRLSEAEFGRRVLNCGHRRVIVTDHTKFGRSGLIKVCDFADFDLLVTNAAPAEELQSVMEEAGVAIEVAG